MKTPSGPNLETFEPQVAGMFYPQGKHELTTMIKELLSRAKPNHQAKPTKPLGIIVPHAGYPYSGPVAAHAFRAISGHQYKHVVVLASAHRQRFPYPALLNQDAYRTPLGDIPIDRNLIRSLADTQAAKVDNTKFANEHALEVELPFLQMTLSHFNLVAVMISDPSPEKMKLLARALNQRLARQETLYVASTDMSHDHAYDTAVALDNNALKYIKNLDTQGLYTANQTYYQKQADPESQPNDLIEAGSAQLCGLGPVLALMELSSMTTGAQLIVLDHRNSGDIIGDKQSRIVGYFSAVAQTTASANPPVKKPPSTQMEERLSQANKNDLLSFARNTLKAYFEKKPLLDFEPEADILRKPAGAFVTLKKKGLLRGCIGHMEASQPLWKMVRDRALDAALRDPRFDPVIKNELEDIHIEISVLSPKIEVKNPLEEIIIGRDGVWLELGGNRGVFLPQVPVEQGWKSVEEYLDHLCQKAHLFKPRCWKHPEARIHRFTALVFSE